MFRMFSLEDNEHGKRNEEMWFQDIDKADQKTKARMIETLSMAGWPSDSSSRLASLKEIFVDDKATVAMRMAIIHSFPTTVVGRRRSIDHKELSRFFLELFDSGKCSKEHVREMLSVISQIE